MAEQGTVKWFNDAKRATVSFISRQTGEDVFAHFSGDPGGWFSQPAGGPERRARGHQRAKRAGKLRTFALCKLATFS